MRRLSVLVIVLLLIYSVSLVFSLPDFTEGKWQITTTIIVKDKNSGMIFKLPQVVHEECLTKDRNIPRNKKTAQGECKILKNEVKGNTITWKMSCETSGATSIINGTIHYKRTTLSGKTRVTINKDGRVMKMKQKLKGKYIGQCDN